MVLGVERLGVDTNRIEVVADPAITTVETAKVDGRAMSRPARRVGIGATAGLLIGVAIAAAALTWFDAEVAPTLLSMGIACAVIGALVGLYSQLAMNAQLNDIDTGQESMVRVDVAGLDDETANAVDQLLCRR